jgi:hypothetical protein
MPEQQNTNAVRVLLDLQFAPDDVAAFVPDIVMEALDQVGTIGEVRLLWAGPNGEPIGNVPWPRTAPDDEQAQTDAAQAQIEEEANAPTPEPEEQPEDPDPDEVIVGNPGEDEQPTEPDEREVKPLAGQPEQGDDDLAESNDGYSPKADPAPVDDPAPEQSAPKKPKTSARKKK